VGLRDAIDRYYRPRFEQYEANSRVLGWEGDAEQAARFAVLPRAVRLDGRSLLDVGSGLGDLYGFLRARRLRVDYTGVDLLPEMVARARDCQPGARFACGDLLGGELFAGERFDVVYCSGVFNIALGNNEAFFAAAFARLVGLAQRAVVVNLLHKRSPDPEPGYWYTSPAEVRSLAGVDTLEFIDDYLPNDFTVIWRAASG
jgi:SAM-dependent methyltransferase